MVKKTHGRVLLSAAVTGGTPLSPPSSGRPAVRSSEPRVTAGLLQGVARRMVPFYRKVSVNATFASQWSKAVVDGDLDRMLKLLKAANPRIGKIGLGTNGIGYFVDFPQPEPLGPYANGTTIPPGTVQFVFEPRAHRTIAAAVLPFYRKLAADPVYARRLAAAIMEKDAEAAACLVRTRVKSPYLRSVAIEALGLALKFRFPFSTYTYRNLMFRDADENG